MRSAMEVKGKNMSASELELASLTADIVAAYVVNNVISGDKLPEFIGSVYTALKSASVQGVEPPKVELTPAVPVKKSVTHDYITCLEDGKKFKSLKRHLKTHYDLSPEEYREKCGLPRDYPIVAPAYAAARSSLAKSMGLGRRNGSVGTDKPAPKTAKSVSKRARKAA